MVKKNKITSIISAATLIYAKTKEQFDLSSVKMAT